MSPNAKPQPRWQQIAVTGSSMQPTLQPGDYVLIRRSSTLKPGQMVLLEDEKFRLVIKRLISKSSAGWWVLGDNLAQSIDSRQFGAVAESQIKGVVVARYWPKPKFIKSQI